MSQYLIMIARSFTIFCVLVLLAFNIGYDFVKAETEEKEVAEENMAPKEEYQNVLENLPLLYTHVVDVLQENPEVLERNDVRMKRHIERDDNDNIETEDVMITINKISSERNYFTEILQYIIGDGRDSNDKVGYDLSDDIADSAYQSELEKNAKYPLDKKNKRDTETKEIAKDNVDVNAKSVKKANKVKKRDTRSKKVNLDGLPNLERMKRSVEGIKLTREEVERLYELVEAEIEKANMNAY